MTALAVTASCGGMKKAKLQGISISSSSTMVMVGNELQLQPNLRYPPPRAPLNKPAIRWSSSSVDVATVSSTGVVKGVKVGTTSITAELDNQRAMISISVVANRVLTGLTIDDVMRTVSIGSTAALVARGLYSDGTNAIVSNATWSSSDATVASVSTPPTNAVGGLVVGLKAGMTTITASLGGFNATSRVTVSGATLRSLAVTPPTATTARMVNFDFKATATFNDNTTRDVTTDATWTSSNTGVATVSGGRATGVTAGQASIIATFGGMTAMSRLTVTNLAVAGLTVTPATVTLPLDTTEKLTATARLSDNSTQDVSTSATWTSSDLAVATVDGNGLVTSVAPGTANVVATFGSFTAMSTITVTNATLSTISVTPSTKTLIQSLQQQYAATGLYSDNTQRVITNDVTWSTANQAVAGISNSIGMKGLLTAVGPGDTMVTASLSGKVGSATVTVSSATLSALAISPANERVAVGGLVAYEARALLSDGSNLNVTTEVSWSSSNTTAASISNASGTRGHATGLAQGTTTITANLGTLTATTTLTVSNATLVSINVIPVTRTVAKGTSVQLVATGIYSDNSNANLTELADWTSSVSATATVSSSAGTRGLVTGVVAGTAVITATFGGQSATSTITVTNATLTSLAISPTNQTIAFGTFANFQASGVFSDSTTQDLTNQVAWSSGTPAVATISSASPTWGRATGLTAGTSVITATFGTVTATTNLTVTNATLSSLAVTPATNTIPATFSAQLTATGTFSDSTTQDLTEEVFWASSNNAIATVSIALGDEGEVTGVAAGMATITATFGIRTGTAAVTVTNATLSSIAVTPPTATISITGTQQFLATGTFSDTSTLPITNQVTWISSNNAVAVVSNVNNSEGLATPVAPGSVTVTAARGTTTGTATLTVTSSTLVSISVTANPSTIADGTTSQLTAIGVYSDNSNQDLTESVTWSSATTTVASISNTVGTRGRATGVDPGTSVITATLGAISGMATLTVTPATLSSIAITPGTQMIALGTEQQFVLTGTYSDTSTQTLTDVASWTSSMPLIASISNTAPNIGKATALTVGTTTITAAYGGQTAMATLTVSNATLVSLQIQQLNPSVANGVDVSFTVVGTYSDTSTQTLTTSATWTSSNPAVATISNATGTEGRAETLAVGTTSISASIGAIVAPAQTLTVSAATLVSIAVTPPTPSIANGTTQQFTATGTYTDGSTGDLTASATWSTIAGTGTATIENGPNDGLATAATVGTVTVRATSGMISGDALLTVTAAVLTRIDVTPLNTVNSPLGLDVQFTATGVYTDTTTQNLTSTVTWSSSNTAVATISNALGTEGLAETLTVGTTTITATNGTLTSAPASLNVGAATVASVAIGGLSQIANLTMSQLTATATYTDSQTQDVTTVATWGSSNTGVAQIGGDGIVTGISPGVTTLTAAFGGQTGMRVFTVSNATILSMALSPTTPSIADGATQQFTPTATFSDSTTQNMILQATWASGTAAVATVSNAVGSKGLATAVDAGMSTINATWNGISGATVLTVTPKTLDSITVTPSVDTIIAGTTRRLTATGNYSDASTADLTATVTWSTSNAPVATVSNAGMTKGTATGVALGTATITATLGLVAGTSTLNVSANAITSITVTPAMPSIAAGTTQQFVATANLTGGGTQDITELASWSTSAPFVTSVSNADGSRGLVTGLIAGMANITASYNMVSSNAAALTVTNATLSSIAITTTSSTTVPNGIDPAFIAIGTYSDGSTQTITALLTWASSDTNVATISNAGGTEGNAETLMAGTTNITATDGTVTGMTTLTVTAATLVSIAVTPAADNVNAAATKQYTATATYSDASTQNVTSQATWSSTNAGVATVSNALGTEGLATGIATGMTMIRATFTGISGSTDLTVN
jgi:uncharacterized protein YjdB